MTNSVQPQHNRVTQAFDNALSTFLASDAIQHLLARKLTVEEYGRILREIYFYTRENPQLQAALTLKLTGRGRSIVKPMLRHSASEIGHDQLALDDLKTIGQFSTDIVNQRPRPTTNPMIAWPHYAIAMRRPAAYLAHIYFLEHMPTTAGAQFAGALLECGIPKDALTFLEEHVAVDVSHNKLMELYLNETLLDEADYLDFEYGLHVTSNHYAAMLAGAIWGEERHSGCVLDPVESIH